MWHQLPLDNVDLLRFGLEKKREEKKKEGQKRNYSCSENAKFSADVEGVETEPGQTVSTERLNI